MRVMHILLDGPERGDSFVADVCLIPTPPVEGKTREVKELISTSRTYPQHAAFQLHVYSK